MTKQAIKLSSTLIALISTVSVAAAAPILRLTAAGASIALEPNATGTSTAVELYNAGDGTLSPAIASTASWLTATAGSSANCSLNAGGCLPLTITANAAGLTPGMYTGYLIVSAPGAVDAPQTITVALQVGGVPSTINLYVAPNGGSASQTVYTNSAANVQASTASGGNWLTSTAQILGATGLFYPYLITATSQTGQAAGSYTGKLVITGSNYTADNQTVNVNLTVTTSPILQVSPAQVTLIAGANATATASVSLANGGEGSLSVTGASAATTTGSGWLSASVASGGGSVSITANASGLTPGLYQGTINVASNAVNTLAQTIPVSFLVTSETGPQIGFGGAVNIGTYLPTAAPGDIAAVFGLNLTNSTTVGQASSTPLPDTLQNTQVLVNGVAAPLYFTSSGQINFEVPEETQPGQATVQVMTNGAMSNAVSMTVKATVPTILLFATAGSPPVIINYSDGSVPTGYSTLLPSHPAKAGDVLVVYAVGFGATTPAVATGAAAPGSPLAMVTGNSSAMFGGGFMTTVLVSPQFIGLAPGLVGLYQINVQVPSNAPQGDMVPLSITANGVTTPTVFIAIQ